ncbi:MAG: RsmB/NOP family class I SAM-dependent RNA methyltransferase [Candidatus Bathyarchaeia archaeon]
MLKEAWTLAIESLSWIEMQKLSERLALAKTVRQLGIGDADAVRLAHMLVCETVRRRNLIDAFINNVLKPKTIGGFDLGVQAFLRLYVYQTRIARNWSKIDVKEAENIAKTARAILGWKSLKKVEPFLGALLTQNPRIVLDGLGDEERVALLTFHPTWFVKYCFRLFGRVEAIKILEANLQAPPTYIRLNTLRASEETILDELEKEGVEVEKVKELQYAYKVLATQKPLTRIESFQKGFFYIQDKASCFAAETANPKPDMVVLDVCAAPGAKTTYLAQLMQNQGAIYSIDYSRRRIGVWKSEINRMGVKIATPIIADVCNPLPVKLESDIVVLDPPCTSTGAFGKLPSAKWRLTKRSVDKMAEIQWQMLCSCADKVKAGGTLVYSTCSITTEENEMLIERFLKRHPEFSLVDVEPKMGLPGFRGMEKCRRLYPHINECNGFFIAKLLKSKP